MVGGKKDLGAFVPPVIKNVIDALPVGVFIASLDSGEICYINDSFKTIFGLSFGGIRTVHQFIEATFVHERQREVLRQRILDSMNPADGASVTNLSEIELDVLSEDGKVYTMLHYSLVLHEQGVIVSFFRDISAHKRDFHMLRRQAFFDPLTGVSNRRGLEERWRQETTSAPNRRLAFLVVDLDDFKPINDTYGHEVGDEVLKTVALLLKEAVRDSDLVCRLGGDEFGVLLAAPDDFDQLASICDRIAGSLGKPIKVGDIEVRVRTSIGGCLYPDQAADKLELLRRADWAMYRTKRLEKGGWSWYANGLKEAKP